MHLSGVAQRDRVHCAVKGFISMGVAKVVSGLCTGAKVLRTVCPEIMQGFYRIEAVARLVPFLVRNDSAVLASVAHLLFVARATPDSPASSRTGTVNGCATAPKAG
jgi:hypothetical protein